MARSVKTGICPVARLCLEISVKHHLPSHTYPLCWITSTLLVLYSQRLLSFVSRRWMLILEFIHEFMVHTTTALCSSSEAKDVAMLLLWVDDKIRVGLKCVVSSWPRKTHFFHKHGEFALFSPCHWAWRDKKPFCTHTIWDAVAFMPLSGDLLL